uniref:Uncharacterized protein n=1 Tax=Anguilla anguilla TaxID=7936 RepID=A0A0E9TS45_ANGAN
MLARWLGGYLAYKR